MIFIGIMASFFLEKRVESVMLDVDVNELIENCDLLLLGIGSGIGGIVTDGKKLDYDSSKKFYEIVCDEKKEEQLAFYNSLHKKIEKKNHFVLDTNMDGIIEYSNFQKNRVVSPCGSMFRVQCGCLENEGIWDSWKVFDEGKKVCPRCGRTYVANIHGVEGYNENPYRKNWSLYNKWLSGTLNRKLVILELGSDFRYASLMRWPFEKVVMLNQKAVLIRVNKDFPQGIPEIKDRFLSFEMEPYEFVQSILL